MNKEDLEYLINNLISLPKETEWVEFKHNYFHPQDIGEYISALSNSACLIGEKHAYLVYGIDNLTHKIIGTNFHGKNEKINGHY